MDELKADASALAWQSYMRAEEENPDALLVLARRLVHVAETWRDRRVLGLADQAALARATGQARG